MFAVGSLQTLVLNADYRPYLNDPLSVWPWQEAVKAVFSDRVNIVAEYDEVVRSPSYQMRVPSVIALREYIHVDYKAPLTRYNINLRDGKMCLYCAAKLKPEEVTWDHVLPRSKGGRTTWENIASACMSCNLRKADKLLSESGMVLLKKPYHPTHKQLSQLAGAKALERRNYHKTWQDFLYWDSELEEGAAD